MSFPSLDIPGAQHIHILTPWWLFLIYSFFHPKCWKHQIGEKGEEKIKPLQYFLRKKSLQPGAEYFRNGAFFPPQHFSCFSTRAFPSITPLIQFFFFSLNFPHLLYSFAARPRKWLRRAVGFFPPPLTVCFSPRLLRVLNANAAARVTTPERAAVEMQISSHLPRGRPFQLHTSSSCLLSSSFHTQFLPGAASAPPPQHKFLGINGSAEASTSNLFPGC